MKPAGDTASDARQFYEDLWAEVQPESSRRLLMSALACFAVKGFAGTTTREIAEGAGVSSGGLYVHYRTKGELLYEISYIGHRRNWENTEAAIKQAEGPADQLIAFVDSFVSWHARFHTLARVCQYELSWLTTEQLTVVRRWRRRHRSALENILVAGIRNGEFECHDLRGTGRAILSLGVDVARWFDGSGEFGPEQIAASYVDLALRMAGVRDAASGAARPASPSRA